MSFWTNQLINHLAGKILTHSKKWGFFCPEGYLRGLSFRHPRQIYAKFKEFIGAHFNNYKKYASRYPQINVGHCSAKLALILLFLLIPALVYAQEIDDALINAVICVESGWDSQAVSEDGCRGLMQISEIVFKEFQDNKPPIPKGYILLSEWDFDNMFNPYNNIEVGTWYLNRIKSHYLKDKGTLDDILICYNFGFGNWKKWREGKIKLPKETRDYLKKVREILGKEI